MNYPNLICLKVAVGTYSKLRGYIGRFSCCKIYISDGNARGTETLYFPGSTSGRELANCIQAELYGTLFLLDPDWSDRGLKERSDLAVLKYTDMPAALVECAFIDNEPDAYFLMHYGDEIARSIARGVTDYEAMLYQNP